MKEQLVKIHSQPGAGRLYEPNIMDPRASWYRGSGRKILGYPIIRDRAETERGSHGSQSCSHVFQAVSALARAQI